jgi:pyruvate ferredoxin oxidoreductase delta subunit
MTYEQHEKDPISPWLPCNSSMNNHTGKWALKQPRIDTEKCTVCLKCWIFCPDSAIILETSQVSVNPVYCKGCGICEVECPVNAITMVEIQ